MKATSLLRPAIHHNIRPFSKLSFTYKPPVSITHFSNIETSALRGRHFMLTGTLNGKKYFLKDITSFAIDEAWARYRESPSSVPFEDFRNETISHSQYTVEREVFLTSLLQLMLPGQTTEHAFVAQGSHATDNHPIYYVATQEIPHLESLQSFPKNMRIKDRFSVDSDGYTQFSHPKFGKQWTIGRIATKVALCLLGEGDPNLENFALIPIADDSHYKHILSGPLINNATQLQARRKVANQLGATPYNTMIFATIDHELCTLYHPNKNTTIEYLTTRPIDNIFPEADIFNLNVTRRQEAKELAVLHFNQLFNTDTGRNKIKSLICTTFSPRGKLLEQEIYKPLQAISDITRSATTIILQNRRAFTGWAEHVTQQREQAYHDGITSCPSKSS